MSFAQLDQASVSQGPTNASSIVQDQNVKHLLNKFQTLFAAPTGLPPVRPIDHRIPLKLNAGPINMRPYQIHIHKNQNWSPK